MRKQYKAYLFSFLALVALLTALSGTSMVFAKAQTSVASHHRNATLTCSGLSIVPSPNVGSGSNYLKSVAAVSESDVWAVGLYVNSSSAIETLIEHWNGTKWRVVPNPNPGPEENTLFGVSELSSNDVWAVGYYFNSSNVQQTLIEHWNGTNWSVLSSPNAGSETNTLSNVSVVSADDVWAVGFYQNSGSVTQALIEHWDGSRWSVVPSPSIGSTGNSLTDVAAVSASNIWAIGKYSNYLGPDQTLIEHWNGTSWSVVPSPSSSSTDDELSSVTVVSVDNIWAVGYYFNYNQDFYHALIEHWNGTKWSLVGSPFVGNSGYLFGVAAFSASNIWAVGVYSNEGVAVEQTLIEQWNGTSWNVVGSLNFGSDTNELLSVAAVPDSSTVWAVGDHTASSNDTDRTLIERYC